MVHLDLRAGGGAVETGRSGEEDVVEAEDGDIGARTGAAAPQLSAGSRAGVAGASQPFSCECTLVETTISSSGAERSPTCDKMQERSHDGPHDAAPGGLLGAPCGWPCVRSRSGGVSEAARSLRCCAAGCEAGRAKSCERERGSLCLTRTNSCDRERSSLCLTRTSSLNVRAEILGLADRHQNRILALFGISKSRSSMRESKRSRSPRVHSDQEW